MKKLIPGTHKVLEKEDAFQEYIDFIKLTNGLSLSQVCSIASLDAYTIQNWVKRGYVANPVNKKYYEKQLARILMINSLKDAMKIEEIADLMILINGDVEDESDDLISESDLYSLLVKVMYNIQDDYNIKETINQVLKKEVKRVDKKKLSLVLEIMAHGYIASRHRQRANQYLLEIKEK